MATTKVTTYVIDMSGNAGGLTWLRALLLNVQLLQSETSEKTLTLNAHKYIPTKQAQPSGET